MQFRGGEYENNMLRRFFQGLQQGIKGGWGEHMYFINYDDFVSALSREKTNILLQFPYLINATVGGAINFLNINGIAACDLRTMFTLVARYLCRPFLAIKGLGNQSGKGCLANSPNTTEYYGVWNAIPVNTILKRPDNRLLTDNFLKCLWAPLSG
jgi:hypothetical protein